MNIKEATAHIKNAISAYLEKNEKGNYFIPVEKQRPVFLYGPPGIGKTAVMEQIAEELNIGIVSYSMTHHTRQSAIGLPFITKKKFGDKEYDVSEYTMSEILASVYSYIEETGKTEGILFLDEINCVSETLAPSMLRFLQYKTFGSHSVPDGWVVVTAGNPPEYNKSVREYDIATLDRIKKITVEADYGVWREYALNRNIHPSVIAYLDIKKSDFYIIENTPDKKDFVTARGWEDLSKMIQLFEKKSFEIDISLIEQYIHSPRVADSFADYYRTYKTLKEKYSPDDILNGVFDIEIKNELVNSDISVRLGVIGILCEKLCACMATADDESKEIKAILSEAKANNAPLENERLRYIREKIPALKENVLQVQNKAGNAVDFISDIFGNSPESAIFITNITLNKKAASFLMGFGCEKFENFSKIKYENENILKELEEYGI